MSRTVEIVGDLQSMNGEAASMGPGAYLSGICGVLAIVTGVVGLLGLEDRLL